MVGETNFRNYIYICNFYDGSASWNWKASCLKENDLTGPVEMNQYEQGI